MKQTCLTLTTRKPEAYHIASILDPQFEEDGVTSVLFETQEDMRVLVLFDICAGTGSPSLGRRYTRPIGT